MTTNKIDDVRSALFAQMDRLAKATDPASEIERSKAMADLAQVVINSAKVEVDFIRTSGTRGSGFIPDAPELEQSTSNGVIGTTVHRIR